MMRSLFSGVSGLKGHQTRMDVIGNNIANVNTTGFKSSRTTFADTFSQTTSGASSPTGNLGGTNPKQIGLGANVSSIDLIFTDGSVQSTGKNTDLCLSGNGLFVVNQGNQTFYTRNGAFEFDAEGNYVMPGSGLFVQGWTAQDGVLNTSGAVGNITIPSGKTMEAAATTQVAYTNNLDSSINIIAKVNGYDSTNWTCSDNMPCEVVLTGGTKIDGVSGSTYKVGDVYSSTPATYSSAGSTVTVSKYHSPVTVTLADGTVHEFDYTSTDKNWSYGYTTKTAGDSATATEATSVALTNTTTGRTATGTIGTTYAVGDTVTTTITNGTVTKNTGETLVLTLADGTKHDVTNAAATSYTIGTDTYTYDGGTSAIVSAEVGFTADEMTVTSSEGDGASLRVWDGSDITTGFAQRSVTSATPSASSPVTLTLSNGTTVAGLTAGGPYSVGDNYPGTPVTSGSVTATSKNQVRITLADGTYHDDMGTGTTYTVGDTYTYTNAGGTVVTTTIQSYASISQITNVSVQSAIASIKDNNNILVEDIIPGTVTATPENALLLMMSDGSTQTVTSGSYSVGNSLPITTIVNVFDSLGVSHAVPIYFTKTATGSGETTADGNQWTVHVDGESVKGTTHVITEPDGSSTTVTMDPAVLQFSTSGGLLNGSGTLSFTITDGANKSQTVALDVSQLTQYAGMNTIKGEADGNMAGTLSSISIDSSGIITGTYTNGIKQAEAQVAVAQFNNASGLTKTGNSLYQESNNSGTANVKTAADLGVTITGSALEMSNVDIANEFSDMIITQRGFQSNSKIITVSDELLETVINMKR